MRAIPLTLLLLVLPLLTREARSPERPPLRLLTYAEVQLRMHLNIMQYAESRGDPNAVGRGYYRGWYSIGRAAAKDVGVPYDSLFIPRWADTAMIRYMRVNRGYLEDCRGYVGGTIKDIPITWSKLLSAAHLCGHVAVREWLTTKGKTNRRDGNGKSVEDYMRMMEGVNLIGI